MIDKIVITLSDEGAFKINCGDLQFVHTFSQIEALFIVKDSIKNLGYFPKGNNDFCVNPISYEEFERRKKEAKKSLR